MVCLQQHYKMTARMPDWSWAEAVVYIMMQHTNITSRSCCVIAHRTT